MSATTSNQSEQALIASNIELHERIASLYDQRHSEIYNAVEQERLGTSMKIATSSITSGGLSAMDYGCGAGNLTAHMLRLGLTVTAADVTPSFTQICKAMDPDRVTPFILNGRDLSEFADNSLDLIATYSVLHHIPDYLAAVREFVRVIRPGGVVYIDHEASEEHWQPTKALTDFRSAAVTPTPLSSYVTRLLSPKWWKKRIRKTINPRYAEEGDIHVWPDDHIEWPMIREIMHSSNMEIVHDEAYLLYQPQYDKAVWERYADSCTDMRTIIARKRP